MKQPKKLTRSQKELLEANDFNSDNYMFVREDDMRYDFVHKHTSEMISIMKRR